MTQDRLDTMRRHYAREILRRGEVGSDARLEAAFAAVRREDFIGPPPWLTHDLRNYCDMGSTDPSAVYQDCLIGLDPARGINNGSPSLHARGIHALAPKPGETVVHIGAGTGYYSAILAQMVSPGGRVIAVEYDATLAERARDGLSVIPGVEVVKGNGTDYPREPADVIYVNFATDRPANPWIEQLKPGGWLLFPLGVPAAKSAVVGSDFTEMAGYLLVTRNEASYAARFLLEVSFIWAEGSGREGAEMHDRLRAAFRSRKPIRSLRWKTPPTGEEWYATEDWGLSTKAPGR